MHNISRENILLNLFNTLNIWKRLSHLPTYFILLLLLLFLPCTLITLWRDVGQLGISLWWLFGSLFRCSGTWMSKGPFGFFSAWRKRLVAILQTGSLVKSNISLVIFLSSRDLWRVAMVLRVCWYDGELTLDAEMEKSIYEIFLFPYWIPI